MIKSFVLLPKKPGISDEQFHRLSCQKTSGAISEPPEPAAGSHC